MACPQFKEVVEMVETVRALTCDELIAFTGSAADFCVSTIDSLKAANSGAVDSKPTGKTLSSCGAAQRGQR